MEDTIPNIELQSFLKKTLDETIKEGHIETARKMLDFSKGSFKKYHEYDLKVKELESKGPKTCQKKNQ